jgi:hypothetical protein
MGTSTRAILRTNHRTILCRISLVCNLVSFRFFLTVVDRQLKLVSEG